MHSIVDLGLRAKDQRLPSDATSNKCHASSTRCLTGSNRKLLVSDAWGKELHFADIQNPCEGVQHRTLHSRMSSSHVRLARRMTLKPMIYCVCIEIYVCTRHENDHKA